jgi:hypothetical protein
MDLSLQTAGLSPGRFCIPDETGSSLRDRPEGVALPVALLLPGRLAAQMPGDGCYHEEKAT